MNETINIFEKLCNTSLDVCQKSLYEITMQQQEYAFVTGTIYLIGMIIYTVIMFMNMSAIKKGFDRDKTTTDNFRVIATIGYIIFSAIMLFLVIPDILQWLLNPEYRVLEILEKV